MLRLTGGNPGDGRGMPNLAPRPDRLPGHQQRPARRDHGADEERGAPAPEDATPRSASTPDTMAPDRATPHGQPEEAQYVLRVRKTLLSIRGL